MQGYHKISTSLSKWKIEKNLFFLFLVAVLRPWCQQGAGQMLLPWATTWCSSQFNYTFAEKQMVQTWRHQNLLRCSSSNTQSFCHWILCSFSLFLVFRFNRSFFEEQRVVFYHFLFESRLEWLATFAFGRFRRNIRSNSCFRCSSLARWQTPVGLGFCKDPRGRHFRIERRFKKKKKKKWSLGDDAVVAKLWKCFPI